MRATELRSFVLGLAERLADAEAPVPWSARVRWAKRLLAEVLGGSGRRAGWPEAERRAAERVELALDRLAVLDDLEGPVGLDVFTRALTLELEGDLGRVGRFGEGVLVGPISMGVGVDLDLVVVVGMAGGTLPVRFFSPTSEVVVTTSHWGTRQELIEVVALAASGRLTSRTHEVDLAGVNSAISDLRTGDVAGRVVLVP